MKSREARDGDLGEDNLLEDNLREDSLQDDNRRQSDRVPVAWEVDCVTEDTFLYASIRNISTLGIFVLTREPLEVGSRLTLRFAPPECSAPFTLTGVVQWINPVKVLSENKNPGMGITFVDLTPEDRERLVESIRTIAYVRESPN